MYESFYGLSEKPFTLLPDPDYLYLSPKHQRALTLLEYGMMNQAGFSVICGDTGAGKTTLIRRLLTELGDDTSVGLITNTHQSFGELLNWVLMAFGLEAEGKTKAQMHQIFIEFLIEQYAQNKHAVLIVDEAQNMSADTLEELRMLSNINADKDQILQVILAGQPALRETLRRPELMQFAQRIAVDYYLEALSEEETSGYIKHRLKVAGADREIFTADACKAIYKYSGGTPRLINLLCDTALVYGFAEQSELISVQLVHDVVREQHSNSIIPTFNTSQKHAVDDLPAGEDTKSLKQKNNTGAGSVKKTKSVEVHAEKETLAKTELINDVELENTGSKEVIETDEVIADLAKRAVQAVASAEQSVQTQVVTSSVSSASTHTTDELSDNSNVTPISTRHISPVNEKNNDDSTEFKQQVAESAEKYDAVNSKAENVTKQPVDSENVPLSKDRDETGRKPDFNNDAARHSSQVNETEVYPIVHVEQSPKKGIGVMVGGVIIGMLIASVSMVAIAWMFINSNSMEAFQVAQTASATEQKVQEAENRALVLAQKERDAAVAERRALERERDAALTAAKIQEQMRAVEKRAAEILAEQESRAEKRLRDAQARAREAERAEARALKRERALRLKAEEEKLAAIETRRIKLLKIEQQNRLAQRQNEKSKSEEPVKIQQLENRVVKEVASKTQAVKEKPSKSFSANPCNSPSAKFLSTCKK